MFLSIKFRVARICGHFKLGQHYIFLIIKGIVRGEFKKNSSLTYKQMITATIDASISLFHQPIYTLFVKFLQLLTEEKKRLSFSAQSFTVIPIYVHSYTFKFELLTEIRRFFSYQASYTHHSALDRYPSLVPSFQFFNFPLLDTTHVHFHILLGFANLQWLQIQSAQKLCYRIWTEVGLEMLFLNQNQTQTTEIDQRDR